MEDDLNELFQTNVVGNIRLFNIFLPLIKNGQIKKIVTISTGLSDEKLAVQYELYESGPYSITKSAMNMVNVKFHAEFKKDGIVFMGVCPGTVNTGHNDNRKSSLWTFRYRIVTDLLPHSLTRRYAETNGFGWEICCLRTWFQGAVDA